MNNIKSDKAEMTIMGVKFHNEDDFKVALRLLSEDKNEKTKKDIIRLKMSIFKDRKNKGNMYNFR